MKLRRSGAASPRVVRGSYTCAAVHRLQELIEGVLNSVTDGLILSRTALGARRHTHQPGVFTNTAQVQHKGTTSAWHECSVSVVFVLDGHMRVQDGVNRTMWTAVGFDTGRDPRCK